MRGAQVVSSSKPYDKNSVQICPNAFITIPMETLQFNDISGKISVVLGKRLTENKR